MVSMSVLPRRRPDRMTDADAILWACDRDPLLRPTIVAVVTLDRTPGLQGLLDKVRILCWERRRFRSVVEQPRVPWDRPSWREVEDFDPASHVTHVRAPEPGGLREVLDLAQTVGTRAFDVARPLWELVLVEGMDGGGAALVVKVHHSVIDGIGGLLVIASVLDTDREGTPARAGTNEKLEPTRDPARCGHTRPVTAVCHRIVAVPGQVVAPLRRVIADPEDSVGRLVATFVDSAALVAPTPTPCSSLMRGRGLNRYFGTVDPRGDLRQAAADAGRTLNDLFVGGLLLGLSHYHRRHDRPVDKLRAVIPVSTRRPQDPLETNRFVPVRMTLPADIGTASGYLTEVPPRLSRWKHSEALALDELLTAALEVLPDTLVAWLFASMLKGVDFIATDVPGPPVELYLAGAKVESVFAFAPTSGAALNASLVSMAGRPSLAVSVDTVAVPDPEVLIGCLERGFQEVIAAAESRPRSVPPPPDHSGSS